MAMNYIINYSIPERHYREEVQVYVEPHHCPGRAKRILIATLLGVSGGL